MVVDFSFNNVKEGQPIGIGLVTIDNGETWMSLEDWISDLDNVTDPIIFVRRLKYVFRFIELKLLEFGYEPKSCQDKGTGWHEYQRHFLKDNGYVPRIFGEHRDCNMVTFKHFRMYDAEKWLGTNRDIFAMLNDEEYQNLLKLSKDPTLESTPSKEAWKSIKKLDIYGEINPDIYRDIESGIEGGIIIGQPAFYKTAYHYDVTSLYPYIMSSIEKFPSLNLAYYTNKELIADHTKYAYWIAPTFHCDTTIQTIPIGSIVAPLLTKNKYKNLAIQMYQEKDKAIKGTPEYTIAKLKVNSFIGRLIMKNRTNTFYPYSWKDCGKIKAVHKKTFNKDLGAYTYIIAKAREYILSKVKLATNSNAQVLQLNTDGFFTDNPIPYDKDRFLGSLRYEYKASNLTIFHCNQYVCDQEVCIAGLPKELYKPNQINYKVLSIIWQDGCYRYIYRKLTLGEENYEKQR